MNKQQYWIQQQAPAGNYFDYLGLDPRTDITDALDTLDRFQSQDDSIILRLVVRTDAVIA